MEKAKDTQRHGGGGHAQLQVPAQIIGQRVKQTVLLSRECLGFCPAMECLMMKLIPHPYVHLTST